MIVHCIIGIILHQSGTAITTTAATIAAGPPRYGNCIAGRRRDGRRRGCESVLHPVDLPAMCRRRAL